MNSQSRNIRLQINLIKSQSRNINTPSKKLYLAPIKKYKYVFKVTLLRANQEIVIRLQSNLITGKSRNINTSSK